MLPKPSVQSLKPYTTKSHDYTIKLDANEATQNVLLDFVQSIPNDLYRYPDNHARLLREKAAEYYEMNPTNMIAGNGSSELIELILKTYIDYQDTVIGFEPSFTMYKVFSDIYSANYIGMETDWPFDLNAESIINLANQHQAKIILLCTPNNPTGKAIDAELIKQILENTNALVVVDEAYIEFYDQTKTMLTYLADYDRLIVLRTVSKALGLAGIRLGFLFAHATIVETLNTVKAPYNLNTLTQTFGLYAFDAIDAADAYLSHVKKEREWVYQALCAMSLRVLPSKANFLFFQSPTKDLFEKLLSKGILIRQFTGKLKGYYRVSIGTHDENHKFIQSMKEVMTHA